MTLVIYCQGCGMVSIAPDWWREIVQVVICPDCGHKSLRVVGERR